MMKLYFNTTTIVLVAAVLGWCNTVAVVGVKSDLHIETVLYEQQAHEPFIQQYSQLLNQRILQGSSSSSTTSTPKCNISAPAGSDYACVLQTPEQVCNQYNTTTIANLFTCSCSRYGKTDTQINCTYINEQCSSDNTTCYLGTISQILNIALLSRAITTCTTYTASSNPIINTTVPDVEMCIRIIPIEENGSYLNNIKSCSVSHQIIGSSDPPTICNSCSVCTSDKTSYSSSNTDSTSGNGIEFNCCNAVSDLQQSTCIAIDPISGITIPQIDILSDDQIPGQCTSNTNTYTDSTSYRHYISSLVSLYAVTVWILSVI